MTFPLRNRINPTISEVVLCAQEDARPRTVFATATREDVLNACRRRELPVRDGRIWLGGNNGMFASLTFGLFEALR